LIGNPRYLKTLVDDISVWGEFEELTAKIKKDLRAQSSAELYEIVLSRYKEMFPLPTVSRLESDYDNEKEVVKNFLCLLWASRRGLFLETGKICCCPHSFVVNRIVNCVGRNIH
jgi:hypothetical protein